jgi:hypothetical protein
VRARERRCVNDAAGRWLAVGAEARGSCARSAAGGTSHLSWPFCARVMLLWRVQRPCARASARSPSSQPFGRLLGHIVAQPAALLLTIQYKYTPAARRLRPTRCTVECAARAGMSSSRLAGLPRATAAASASAPKPKATIVVHAPTPFEAGHEPTLFVCNMLGIPRTGRAAPLS